VAGFLYLTVLLLLSFFPYLNMMMHERGSSGSIKDRARQGPGTDGMAHYYYCMCGCLPSRFFRIQIRYGMPPRFATVIRYLTVLL